MHPGEKAVEKPSKNHSNTYAHTFSLLPSLILPAPSQAPKISKVSNKFIKQQMTGTVFCSVQINTIQSFHDVICQWNMLTLMWKRSLKRAAPPSSITSPCLGLKVKVMEALISGFMSKSEVLPLTPPDLIHPSPSHPSPPPWSATSIQVQHMIGN